MTVVVASWVLLLLAAFGVSYAHDVIGEARLVQLECERHQLRAWARSGIELTRATLEATPAGECADLGRDNLQNPLAVPLTCGAGQFAIGHPRPTAGSDQWLPGLGDEASRLPVSLADSLSLATLPGMTPHGIKVLLQAKTTADGRRLPPFAMLADLDDQSRESAGRFLSRYGSAVNINTASREVLLAVGLPGRAVARMLTWRAGTDRIPGNADDQRFLDVGGDSALIRACGLNSEEAAVLALLAGTGRLTVASRYFGFVSRSWGENQRGICEIRVVIEKPERGPLKIMEWTESWLN